MSVIIRLQNLPWSANALDIRQFFKGLSIPEGGVHIVGGEMGDAFIAFSTDEDARQAMMRDREAINGVQVRLLLSSRAEMQKVIETARQQSLMALKNASLVAPAKVATPPTLVATPQPPVITTSSFQNILSNPVTATPSFLAYQKQAGITLIPEPFKGGLSKINNDSDDSENRHNNRDHRRRSDSRERRSRSSRSNSRERSLGNYRRRRGERSRERSRERDRTSGGRRSIRRSRSRERSRVHSRDRSRDRSRERSRSSRDNTRRNSRDGISKSRNMDIDFKSSLAKQNSNYQGNSNSMDSNNIQLSKISSYQANYSSLDSFNKSLMNTAASANIQQISNKLPNQLGRNNSNSPVSGGASAVSVTAVSTTFQNYSNSINPSLAALNNYSLSSLLSASSTSNDSFRGFALQNPYTTALNTAVAQGLSSKTTTTTTSAIPGIFIEKKAEAIAANQQKPSSDDLVPQEPIAFANINPYEQMYPKLFAQAAALGSSGQKSSSSSGSNVQPPKQSILSSTDDSSKLEQQIKSKEVDPNETNCIKISNMCSRTNYSDLRKFFVGLFIPHNGIKMLNDKHGLRVGIAYVQFSRQSCVAKALCRSNNLLSGKSIIIEAVAEQEFDDAEDSYRPSNPYRMRHESDEENGGGDSTENNKDTNTGQYSALNPYKKIISTDPFTVLYIEDIPSLATEQDIMKMFNSYSLYDILLLASPENRREFVAYVRFSREEDAKSAYEDRAHHQIGYRRLRVRPGTIAAMENAKEKIRLANEQLMKEEQAVAKAAEDEETKRKLEKLITEQITLEEEKQLKQNIVSMDLTAEEEAEEEDEEELEYNVIEDDNDDDEVIDTTHEIEQHQQQEEDENYNEEDDGDEEEEEYNENDEQNADTPASQDNYRNQNNNNFNKDPRRAVNNNNNNTNIPSLLDVDPMNIHLNNAMANNRNPAFNDPRLRNTMGRLATNMPNNMMMGPGGVVGGNQNPNFNNFNPNFNNQQQQQNLIKSNPLTVTNSIQRNFVILKNCEYNTRINDIAQLLITANLGLKHIEPLHNERQLPTGEFIVEFRRPTDAATAIQQFHNIQFRNRSLRVFPILPQEIADRLGKTFLSYIPGGDGPRTTDSMMGRNEFNSMNNLSNNNSQMINSRFGNSLQQRGNIGNNINSFRSGSGVADNLASPTNTITRSGNAGGGVADVGGNNDLKSTDNDNLNNNNNNTPSGIPEKFSIPGCVLSLENVPYKAQLSDILRFFQGYDLIDDDIIRRFNDDGSPTGDARVAFATPEMAQAAFEAKKRKQIFGRTIYLNII